MANHTAAIHVLKSKLRMTDDDYRALLQTLTGKSSSKDMTEAEQRAVRDHMQALGERMGVVQAASQRRPLNAAQFDRLKKRPAPKSARCGPCGTSCTETARSPTPAPLRSMPGCCGKSM